MSRNNKLRRKQKQQKRARRNSGRFERTPRWVDVCDQADDLILTGQWDEACEVLEEYEKSNPGQTDVLHLLAEVYQARSRHLACYGACRRLLEQDPFQHTSQLMAAQACLANGWGALAVRGFRCFLTLRPDDPLAEGVRETISQLEPAVETALQAAPFPAADRFEMTCLHEEIRACLALGENADAARYAEQLLADFPDFVPAINNLSQAYFFGGRGEEAVAVSRDALERDPKNAHALANLSRQLFLLGRFDEAEAACRQLRTIDAKNVEIACKKAETLSFLGDDAGILAAFAKAERSGRSPQERSAGAVLHHLAAVASVRQGNERRARTYWRKAIALDPDLSLAKANRDDLNRPISERQGGWSYTIDYWLPKQTIEDIREMLQGQDGLSADSAARRFAERHPEIEKLVPALLDRSDECGRQFALLFAKVLKTPAMLNALREFCLSRRGPDGLRMETAQFLSREGVLTPQRILLWVEGQQREVELFAAEIVSEPMRTPYPQEVHEWMCEAVAANRRGDGRTAERLIKRCIDAVGEQPDLLNNLASALEVQGRRDETYDLMLKIQERWPDYFFGRIAMANYAAMRGDFDQAEEYLAPLRRRDRLHYTEFAALASAYIQLCQARGEFEGAQSWIEVWRTISAEDPNLKRLEKRGNFSLLRKALMQAARRTKREPRPGHNKRS